MSLKKYKAFVHSVECGTLSKAAEKLGVTQSGLTHLIFALEMELGFSLMVRNKGGIRLSDEGKRIFPLIKEVVEGDRRVKELAQKINGEITNVIHIGTFTSVAVNWLPSIMNGFKSLHPDIDFKIIDGGYYDIHAALEDGTADIGFIALPSVRNLKCYPLVKDRMLAVVAKDHPLAERERLPVGYFACEPVISLAETTDHDSRAVFEAAGITPNLRYCITDDYAMISMVENNMGIGLVPELLLGKRAADVKLMEVEPPAFRTIGLAMPYENQANPLIVEFAEYILKWVKKNCPNAINA